MSATETRQTNGVRARDGRRARSGFFVATMSFAVLVIGLSIPSTRGANAAGDIAAAESEAVQPAAPIVLAGRWSGPRYGYGRSSQRDCDAGPCTLTYDVVACGADWCGIAVGKDEACGGVAMKLASAGDPDRPNSFKGRLELAKGADAYVVEAWWRSPADDGEKPHLSMVGDTGPELIMFRRSFPFSAELARLGDAKCTLEKPTS